MRAFLAIGGAMVFALCLLTVASAEEWQTRTWPELKAETQARADRGAYPVFGIKSQDAHDALAQIDSLDPDQWGAAWTNIGDRYFSRAQTKSRLMAMPLRLIISPPGGSIRLAAGRSPIRRRSKRPAARLGRRSMPMAGWSIPGSNR